MVFMTLQCTFKPRKLKMHVKIISSRNVETYQQQKSAFRNDQKVNMLLFCKVKHIKTQNRGTFCTKIVQQRTGAAVLNKKNMFC